MPSSSACQCVISAALDHAAHLLIQYQWQQHEICTSEDKSSESDDSDSSMSNGSDTDSSGLSSSSSSSNSAASTGSHHQYLSEPSSLDSDDAVDAALLWLHHSYILSTHHVWTFLMQLLSTHCLFPHSVSKCSQVGLVLNCYKLDDAYHCLNC